MSYLEKNVYAITRKLFIIFVCSVFEEDTHLAMALSHSMHEKKTKNQLNLQQATEAEAGNIYFRIKLL